ncbi:hypothetical protein DVH05_025506 [Phytophthora capsici]|nr:hypothetical protein DVH05_025506 [Phytophthora capsici]
MERALKLVQGTLAPVPNVTNLVKLLNKDYNDIHKSVRSLLERVLPQSKTVIARVFTTDEFEADVRYVFPRWYVRKTQAAITQFCKTLKEDCENDRVGVRVPRFGVYSLKDMNAMARWHAVLENVELAEEVLAAQLCFLRLRYLLKCIP